MTSWSLEQDSLDPRLEIQTDRDNLEGFEIQFDSSSLHGNWRNILLIAIHTGTETKNFAATDTGTYTQ